MELLEVGPSGFVDQQLDPVTETLESIRQIQDVAPDTAVQSRCGEGNQRDSCYCVLIVDLHILGHDRFGAASSGALKIAGL